MKITPLEIRQKTFEKHFRGYDKDEVNAFLLTLSQEWERLVDEAKEFRIKLEASEKEVMKLREVESSLFKTLKTAEDTGANVIEQARQAADLHLRESQLRAEELLNEAKMKANDTLDEAEQRSKQVLIEMEERLKSMVEEYKRLESTRDDLLLELKRITQDTLERVERFKKSNKEFDADQYLSKSRKELNTAIFPNQKLVATENSKAPAAVKEKPVEKSEPALVVKEEAVEVHTHKITSFFDEIE